MKKKKLNGWPKVSNISKVNTDKGEKKKKKKKKKNPEYLFLLEKTSK